LGRVVDAQMRPIDMNGDILAQEEREIEREIPSIIERDPINESLETGILSIDALIPIGKGQRELIIGSRATGKTTTLLDIILHQQNKEVICVYVAIGQRQANVARFVNILHENDAMRYSVVITASAEESVLYKYLAPYVGTTIAEYFRDQKKDVLIIYDDLSNHAIAYREMSLLLRRAPGREAYPGDIFYLHSRLLERAGKLKNGGSITALPVVQIQGEDIAAYVPTNLISITDGQLYFDQKLFNNNIRPAINTELSVSRVGGAAQTNVIKKMTKALRLQLAQYHELAAFAQFGADLDLIAQHQLERGKRVIEILKQPQHITFDFVQQSLQLFLLKEGLLDNIPLPKVTYFARQFVSYVESIYPNVVEIIKTTQDISGNEQEQLKTIAIEFSTAFST
jgi:F-type H+-transporting ATPase subunit alpha